MEFAPSRDAGLARLKAFLPKAGRAYATERNYDRGPGDRSNVSALSPWIARRLITEREVAESILARHSASACEKFIQEVCWRSYFKGYLEQRPQIWFDYLAERDRAVSALEQDSAMASLYHAAQRGRSGLEPLDIWARELVETGYLHNHARMWFASLWVFTLGLNWALGADFFLRHLMDGDAASNTLSWRWVCGLHTPGKTYLARASNIRKFTDGRIAPESSDLAAAAPALRAPANPERMALPEAEPAPGAPFALLLHGDDLAPFSASPALREARGIGFLETPPLSRDTPGDAARRFRTGAVENALRRLDAADAPRLSADDPEAVAGWAGQSGACVIAAPYAPVGPARTALDKLTTELETRGLRLVRVRNPWDSAFWPHASAGFFKLKKRIPETLKLLGAAP